MSNIKKTHTRFNFKLYVRFHFRLIMPNLKDRQQNNRRGIARHKQLPALQGSGGGNVRQSVRRENRRADRGATPQRARYHSSAIEVEFLKAKAEFTDLPISYVIFITENDIRGENRLIYNFEWTDTATGTPLGNGAHIIFVNGAYTNTNARS